MKNLLYKEWKLNVHPLCIIFSTVFSVLILMPGNPHFLSFTYVTLAYSLLFLGGTKGVDNNDLYYTATLPIRRVDIVKARTASILSLQLLNILVSIPFALLYPFVIKALVNSGENIEDLVIGLEPNLSLYAMAFIYFTLMDLMFLPWYYKNTSKIMVPYMVSTIVSIAVFAFFSVALPMVSSEFNDLFGGWKNLDIQFIFLFISVIIYIGGHFLIVYLSRRNFLIADI